MQKLKRRVQNKSVKLKAKKRSSFEPLSFVSIKRLNFAITC